jgi:nicotinate-nucleotide adenylyltransferase
MPTAGTRERIGVFGGTFDPPHSGHLRVAGDVADQLSLGRVLWIPARRSPFKRDEECSSPEVRLEMVRSAVMTDPRFEVDDRELRRPGLSWTVETLEELRSEHPEADLFLIVGADQFLQFARWRGAERIVRLARVAVMNRAGISARAGSPDVIAAVPGLSDAVLSVPVTDVDVSSTDVRAVVRAGGDPSGMVPEEVERVIRERGLYAD